MIPSWMRLSDGNFIHSEAIGKQNVDKHSIQQVKLDKTLSKKEQDAIIKALYEPVKNK